MHNTCLPTVTEIETGPYNKVTLAFWGISWPPSKGWNADLLNKVHRAQRDTQINCTDMRQTIELVRKVTKRVDTAASERITDGFRTEALTLRDDHVERVLEVYREAPHASYRLDEAERPPFIDEIMREVIVFQIGEKAA